MRRAAAFALRGRVCLPVSVSLPACRRLHPLAPARAVGRRPLSTASTETPPIPASSPSAKAASSASSASSRLLECVLGFLLGVSGVCCVDWLLWWPEPLPLLARLVSADPLILSAVGSAGSLRFSPLWTGNVRELQSCSVRLPVSGDRARATVFARAVYRPRQGEWRIVYLQAAIGGQAQRHSLSVPAEHQLEAAEADSGSGGRRVALALPANFDPQLLPPEALARYQHLLSQHRLTPLNPLQQHQGAEAERH